MKKLKSGHRELLQTLKTGTCRNFLEIAEKMGCHRATVLRYLNVLEKEGYVVIDRTNWKEITVKAVTVL